MKRDLRFPIRQNFVDPNFGRFDSAPIRMLGPKFLDFFAADLPLRCPDCVPFARHDSTSRIPKRAKGRMERGTIVSHCQTEKEVTGA